MGRYFLYRMHPVSVGEIEGTGRDEIWPDPHEGWQGFISGNLKSVDIEPLLTFGGFPEPFLKQERTFHTRWIRSRRELITHEDVRDLTRVEDVDRLEYLVRLLNPRVAASPLSINALKEDLEVAFETVRNWIGILERLYYVYGVKPYSRKLQRAITREQKYYFWDWSEVRDEGPRFENFVMSHLLKACHTWKDFGIGDFDLWYLRDREKREVDGLLTQDGIPWMLVEVKLSETSVTKPLHRYARLLSCDKVVQVVRQNDVYRQEKIDNKVFCVVSAGTFLSWLP